MQFAASFIEYLVTGSLSLLWLVPLCRAIGLDIANVSPSTIWAPILLASVYVIGLILDFVGYKLMHSKRKAIKKKQENLNIRYDKALESLGINKLPSDTAFILYKAPELAKTYATYSSRDRIARGATLNFAIASIVDALILWKFPASFIVSAAFLALAWIAYFAWFRYQSLSRELKKNAVITIIQHDDFSKG